MESNVDSRLPPPYPYPSKSYALSGKIMLTAIVILFTVVVFMVCLHIYARWYLQRVRRRHLRRRSHRRTDLVLHVELNNPNAPRGLDASILSSLPIFVYSPKTHPDSVECAVCLSEFEENEKGRLLPKCSHSFHIECIDMWFHSHSTCPLCRSPVEPVPENRSDVVVSVGKPAETEPGSSSGSCDLSMASSSSLGDRRKAFEMARVTVEVPRNNGSEDDLGTSSPASQGFKSPVARLLSLTRILSINRKTAVISPSSGVGTSCGSATTELDIERGNDESTQHEARVQTPSVQV